MIEGEKHSPIQLTELEKHLFDTSKKFSLIKLSPDAPYSVIYGSQESGTLYTIRDIKTDQKPALPAREKQVAEPSSKSLGIIALENNEALFLHLGTPSGPMVGVWRDQQSQYHISVEEGKPLDDNMYIFGRQPNATTISLQRKSQAVILPASEMTVSRTHLLVAKVVDMQGKVALVFDNVGSNPVFIEPLKKYTSPTTFH